MQMQASRHFSVRIYDKIVFDGILSEFLLHCVVYLCERDLAVVGDYDVKEHIGVGFAAY